MIIFNYHKSAEGVLNYLVYIPFMYDASLYGNVLLPSARTAEARARRKTRCRERERERESAHKTHMPAEDLVFWQAQELEGRRCFAKAYGFAAKTGHTLNLLLYHHHA